jgi:hypothetical protein
LTSIVLNVGRHLIEVHADGYRSEAHTLEIAGGEEQKVEFRLTPHVSPSGKVERPVPSWYKPAWIASVGLLGLTASGAIMAGVLATRSHDDWEAEVSARPGDSKAIAKTRDRTRRLSHVSDGLLGASLLAAASSVTFLVLDLWPDRRVKVAVGVGHAAVRGQF